MVGFFYVQEIFGEPVGLECYCAILITFFEQTKFSIRKKNKSLGKIKFVL